MDITHNKKIMFLVHLLVTLISFYWMVSASFAGLGLFVFGAIQFAFALILCKNKRWALLIGGAMLILCASSFFRDGAFDASNYLAVMILLSALIVLSRSGSEGFRLRDLALSFFDPFLQLAAPFRWIGSALKNKNSSLGKAAFTGGVTLVCVAVVLALLSNADMIFSKGVSNLFSGFFGVLSPSGIVRLYASLLVTIYMFGAFYATTYIPEKAPRPEQESRLFDNFSPSVLLIALIAVYAVFCAIQIKYLFLGAELPDGVNHAEYARQGFFELLVISGINLAVVLTSFRITQKSAKPSGKLTLALCFTLLAITVFLLFSSFWRMYLYYAAHGLTRLRTLVFIFLIFEFIGLALTFVYLARPKFNIIYIYFSLTIVFWLSVNVINIDGMIAKNQVDMYLEGKGNDINYVASLSHDAAPEIARLIGDDGAGGEVAREYFASAASFTGRSWQSLNLSDMRAAEIANKAGISHAPSETLPPQDATSPRSEVSSFDL